MDFLIDTHILIWHAISDEKLSKKVLDTINSRENRIFVSIVSIWELVIKKGLGKLDFSLTLNELEIRLIKNNFEIMDLEFSHFESLFQLSYFVEHKDPFDRMLIAQAIAENVTIITDDESLCNMMLNY